jgi:gas vesicle protein
MTEVHDSPGATSAGAGDQTKQKAQEVAGQAQEKAHEAAGQAKNRLAVEVDRRSSEAGERLQSTAGDVRSVGQELRKQGKDKPAELAERAAEQVERFGGYLHGADGDRLLHDVEDFGRRNPWAVVAGGLATGFLASRFLKASSSRRYRADTPARDTQTRPNAEAPARLDSAATPPRERPLATPAAPPESARPGAV